MTRRILYVPTIQPRRRELSPVAVLGALLVFMLAYCGAVGFAFTLDYAAHHPMRCVEVGQPKWPGAFKDLHCYRIAR